MKDIKARIEKLMADADDCLLISKLTTVPEKRVVFEKLAEEYRRLATELEAIALPDSGET